jgi:hypothetical protein
MKRTAVALLATLQTYPGQPTQGHVSIDNRGPHEAIPVVVYHVPTDPPMKVQVVNMPPVQDVRLIRQTWEYQQVILRPADDVAALLNRHGAAGWEAALQYTNPNGGLVVVMKRLRQ